MQVKDGSFWTSNDGKEFVVLHTIELDGKVWVHYRDQDCPECREYSCYVESFIARFNPVLNDRRSRYGS